MSTIVAIVFASLGFAFALLSLWLHIADLFAENDRLRAENATLEIQWQEAADQAHHWKTFAAEEQYQHTLTYQKLDAARIQLREALDEIEYYQRIDW